jgi:hypothetical protein
VNLEITVLDYDTIGGSDPIGKVTLGHNRDKFVKYLKLFFFYTVRQSVPGNVYVVKMYW